TVQAQRFASPVEAYAQVQPVALLPIKAPGAGILARFPFLPGAALKAGDIVATLEGPDVDAARIKAAAAVKSATAKLAAAKKTLDILQPQLESHLSTRQQIAQAEADVADAGGAFVSAQAEQTTADQTAAVRSPVAGTVVSLAAASG